MSIACETRESSRPTVNTGHEEDVAPDVRSLADEPPYARSLAWALASFAAVSTIVVHAQSFADSPWVGTWLLHEPSHGSYQANEYRFLPTGELRLSATLDTTTRDPARDRILGRVVRGNVVCTFGTRWRPERRPSRVVIESACLDGRARDIVLAVSDDFFERGALGRAPRIVTVGGRPGFRLVSHYPTEILRCGADPAQSCWALDGRRDVHRRDEPDAGP